MNTLSVPYTYRYTLPSSLTGNALQLATSGTKDQAGGTFFKGRLVSPGRAALLLRTLSKVVQARFHIPSALLGRILAEADPVVTCSKGMIRFEGFSGCCGLYARVDLLPSAIEGTFFAHGTTNVDFNPPMLNALATIRDPHHVVMEIGAQAVQLEASGQSVVEKKVSLPRRWLRGFVEAQVCQSRMKLKYTMPGPEASRFLRSLPRLKTNRRETYIVRTKSGLRLSQTETSDAIRVGGLERLRTIENIAAQSELVRIYSDRDTGASAWELEFEDCRFVLAVSPDVWRGFSGEGQALQSLAKTPVEKAVNEIRSLLSWQATLAEEDLLAHEPDRQLVRYALATLGTRGLVGFDLAEQAYFHRELPFAQELVAKSHPRLRAAIALVEKGLVTLAESPDGCEEFHVRSNDVTHRVRLAENSAKCTCTWYAKHGDSRGPCKHILAARLLKENHDCDG
jgi:SWIM zinc finger